MSHQRVVILGASHNPERYSYKAMKVLQEHGHETVLVNRGVTEIEGQPVLADIGDVTGPVDTLTLYVKEEVSGLLTDKILALKPGRVIFNPSTKNIRLMMALDEADIPWIDGCTIVMLKSGQF
jgi:predicted CoA-binding protein